MSSTYRGRILVHVEDTRCSDVRFAQYLAEKALGCSNTAGFVEEEIEGLSGGCDRGIEMDLFDSNLHVDHIHTPECGQLNRGRKQIGRKGGSVVIAASDAEHRC